MSDPQKWIDTAYEQSFETAARDECLNACRNELAS